MVDGNVYFKQDMMVRLNKEYSMFDRAVDVLDVMEDYQLEINVTGVTKSKYFMLLEKRSAEKNWNAKKSG